MLRAPDRRQTEFMLTMFDMIAICSVLVGGLVGAGLGYRVAGAGGAVGGGLLCGYVGLVAGRLPSLLAMRSVRASFQRQTVDQLRADLKTRYYVVHLILAELMSRGEDVSRESPVVVDLLSSDSLDKRRFGIGAPLAFPELAQEIPDYDCSESADVCRAKAARVAVGRMS
jgi:hypothetical protein